MASSNSNKWVWLSQLQALSRLICFVLSFGPISEARNLIFSRILWGEQRTLHTETLIRAVDGRKNDNWHIFGQSRKKLVFQGMKKCYSSVRHNHNDGGMSHQSNVALTNDMKCYENKYCMWSKKCHLIHGLLSDKEQWDFITWSSFASHPYTCWLCWIKVCIVIWVNHRSSC